MFLFPNGIAGRKCVKTLLEVVENYEIRTQSRVSSQNRDVLRVYLVKMNAMVYVVV